MNTEANTSDTAIVKSGMDSAYEELRLIFDFARVHGIVSDALMDSLPS